MAETVASFQSALDTHCGGTSPLAPATLITLFQAAEGLDFTDEQRQAQLIKLIKHSLDEVLAITTAGARSWGRFYYHTPKLNAALETLKTARNPQLGSVLSIYFDPDRAAALSSAEWDLLLPLINGADIPETFTLLIFANCAAPGWGDALYKKIMARNGVIISGEPVYQNIHAALFTMAGTVCATGFAQHPPLVLENTPLRRRQLEMIFAAINLSTNNRQAILTTLLSQPRGLTTCREIFADSRNYPNVHRALQQHLNQTDHEAIGKIKKLLLDAFIGAYQTDSWCDTDWQFALEQLNKLIGKLNHNRILTQGRLNSLGYVAEICLAHRKLRDPLLGKHTHIAKVMHEFAQRLPAARILDDNLLGFIEGRIACLGYQAFIQHFQPILAELLSGRPIGLLADCLNTLTQARIDSTVWADNRGPTIDHLPDQRGKTVLMLAAQAPRGFDVFQQTRTTIKFPEELNALQALGIHVLGGAQRIRNGEVGLTTTKYTDSHFGEDLFAQPPSDLSVDKAGNSYLDYAANANNPAHFQQVYQVFFSYMDQYFVERAAYYQAFFQSKTFTRMQADTEAWRTSTLGQLCQLADTNPASWDEFVKTAAAITLAKHLGIARDKARDPQLLELFERSTLKTRMRDILRHALTTLISTGKLSTTTLTDLNPYYDFVKRCTARDDIANNIVTELTAQIDGRAAGAGTSLTSPPSAIPTPNSAQVLSPSKSYTPYKPSPTQQAKNQGLARAIKLFSPAGHQMPADLLADQSSGAGAGAGAGSSSPQPPTSTPSPVRQPDFTPETPDPDPAPMSDSDGTDGSGVGEHKSGSTPAAPSSSPIDTELSPIPSAPPADDDGDDPTPMEGVTPTPPPTGQSAHDDHATNPTPGTPLPGHSPDTSAFSHPASTSRPPTPATASSPAKFSPARPPSPASSMVTVPMDSPLPARTPSPITSPVATPTDTTTEPSNVSYTMPRLLLVMGSVEGASTPATLYIAGISAHLHMVLLVAGGAAALLTLIVAAISWQLKAHSERLVLNKRPYQPTGRSPFAQLHNAAAAPHPQPSPNHDLTSKI